MNVSQLKAKLTELGVKDRTYSICDEIGDEQYCLERSGIRWFCFYSERGQRTGEKVFGNENDACVYFYTLLSNDPTVL
ncbi:hypothetical protein [Celerinatantimonas sp. YJH-8]|uniref:hypothetical protein n=1 Tax=Celerinatantimonas sp. YJH-8 TaxID=3228714 RepID=UPI0038CA4524